MTAVQQQPLTSTTVISDHAAATAATTTAATAAAAAMTTTAAAAAAPVSNAVNRFAQDKLTVEEARRRDVLAKVAALREQVDSEIKHLKVSHALGGADGEAMLAAAPAPTPKSFAGPAAGPALPSPPEPILAAPALNSAAPVPAADDDFDMFADAPPPSSNPAALSAKTVTGSTLSSSTSAFSSSSSAAVRSTDISRITAKIGGQHAVAGERDDDEGYFKPRTGEILASRYVIESVLGAGVFSCVVRARDTHFKKLASSSAAFNTGQMDGVVAIKLIRANERMKIAGEKELTILRKLSRNGASSSSTALSGASSKPARGRKYCINFLSTFSHHHHLAIVTECMDQSLRKLLNLNPAGVSIDATRVFGRQLFSGLAYIHDCGILHAGKFDLFFSFL